METPYYVELTLDRDGEDFVIELFKDKNMPLEQAKQMGGQFFMGGYIHKEDDVALAPNYTLFPPTAVKRVRLVASSIIQATDSTPPLKLL